MSNVLCFGNSFNTSSTNFVSIILMINSSPNGHGLLGVVVAGDGDVVKVFVYEDEFLRQAGPCTTHHCNETFSLNFHFHEFNHFNNLLEKYLNDKINRQNQE